MDHIKEKDSNLTPITGIPPSFEYEFHYATKQQQFKGIFSHLRFFISSQFNLTFSDTNQLSIMVYGLNTIQLWMIYLSPLQLDNTSVLYGRHLKQGPPYSKVSH